MRYGAYGYGSDGCRPVKLKAENPLPKNDMVLETGNAGADGYTVLATADRRSGERPPTEGYEDGPYSEMEY